MTSTEVRQSFLDFFSSKGHKIVASAPMVVKGDPTLMFTNAGMNQFKDIILGNVPITYSRAADSQKCLRVSGKHNDLEEVGHDTYHHTMFEMLGNWSFGDYFKREAIGYAWEFLTEVMKLDRSRLYVTIFEGAEGEGVPRDEEAYSAWAAHVDAERILLGNKHDNFWEMGETGPCGPCSEIHMDMRPDAERASVSGRELVNKDNPQVIEIWNLVFMQFNRKADGSLEPLPNHHVDTGMGFERLVRAVQGKSSNYDTDVFEPLLTKIGQLSGTHYGSSEQTDIAMRVVADHVRTLAFSITDGQLPSNNKAGYVIRRILRRAVRYNYTFLGQKQPALYKLVPTLVDSMGSAYPELIAQQHLVESVIREEEESFLKTLSTGIVRLGEIASRTRAAGGTTVDGRTAFELYDTYGFPLDLTELMLREQGMGVNVAEFDAAMQEQKERARHATHIETDDWQTLLPGQETEQFVGYDLLECEVQVARYRKVKSKGKEQWQLVFDRTPFYGESGGQVGDTGTLIDANGDQTRIVDAVKENNQIVHICSQLPRELMGTLTARVDVHRRQLIADNHSATHLLQQALQEVLGKHVEQKGSYVSPEALRFDFSHYQKVSEEELRQVEHKVNARIREDIGLEERREVPIDEARKAGAMALFGEKYGDRVRMIRFGESVELCGGTHVKATGCIGYFKILGEASVSAGVRRITAVTADKFEEMVTGQETLLRELGETLKGSTDLRKSLELLVGQNQKLTAQAEEMMQSMLSIAKQELKSKAEETNGRLLLVSEVKPVFAPKLKDLAYQLRGELGECVVVLGTVVEGKPQLLVIIADSLVEGLGLNAVGAIKESAKHIQGGGGGQPFFATAGGRNAEGMEAALREAKYYFQEKLRG